MSERSFEELCVAVSEASSPEDIFEALRSTEGAGWEQALRVEYERLSAQVNPAYFRDEGARQAAAIVKQRLDQLYGEAMRGAGDGDEARLREAQPVDEGQRFTVKTARGAYRVDAVLARGDIATLYEGRAFEGPEAGRRVVLKLADAAADNDLMLDEVGALTELHKGGTRKHFPALHDHFRTPDGRVGAVLERLDGLDLLDIRQRLPAGVPQRHVVWILRRALSALGYAHRLGVLHGNIEPSHVVVRPRDHNVILVDWCYSLVRPASTGRGFKVETPVYSAPEVGQRKPPIPASDLYSLGKCAAFLLGADEGGPLPDGVDDRLARFIKYLTRESPLQRAQDAWEMFEELGRIRKNIFGAHVFEEFKI